MDLDDAKTSRGDSKQPDVGDLTEIYKFPEKKWVTIRLGSGLFSKSGYWVKTKKRDGSPGKFLVACLSYDPVAQERDSTIPDPWRDFAASEMAGMSREDMKDKAARQRLHIEYSQSWFMNAIIRSIQKQLPERMPKPTPAERKSGFKDKDSDSVTAYRVIRLGKSLLGKIQELKGLNTVEKNGAVKAFSVNDPRYGRDLRVYYDSTKAPADQYQVQLGEKRTPLTEEEQSMLTWDLASACAMPTDGMDDNEKKKVYAAQQKNFDEWATKMGIKLKKARKDVDEDEDFDDEEEDEAPKARKGKKPAPKKSRDDDDDDFDDEEEEEAPKSKKRKPVEDDEDDFDDDDEEEEAPKSKKKPAPKGKKPPVDEDDDFDDEDDSDSDDDDDFDDDEEEAPKSKKKPAAKAKGKKPPVDDDDEEAPKSKKKPAPKKKVVEEDDDDFDDDDFDDEEDEAPKSKKPAAKAKPAAKKRKPVEDEDDDDFDD